MRMMRDLQAGGGMAPGAGMLRQKGSTGKRLTNEERNKLRKQREKELRKRKRKGS
jgi:signal recognition particle subunit SRP54